MKHRELEMLKERIDDACNHFSYAQNESSRVRAFWRLADILKELAEHTSQLEEMNNTRLLSKEAKP